MNKKSLIEEIDSHIAKKDWDSAYSRALVLYNNFSSDSEAIVEFVNVLYHQILPSLQHSPLALDLCDKAIAADPTFWRAWMAKALILINIDRLDDAHEILQSLTKSEPKNWIVWWLSCDLLIEMQRYSEAEAAIANSINLNPNGALAWREYARLLMVQKKLAESEIAFKQSLKCDSQNYITWREYGRLLSRSPGRLAECVNNLRIAADLNPEDSATKKLLEAALNAAEASTNANHIKSDIR